MVTSDFLPEVEIRPFRACAMHQVIIIGTVRSLDGRGYGADTTYVSQNAFQVLDFFVSNKFANIYGRPSTRVLRTYSVLKNSLFSTNN